MLSIDQLVIVAYFTDGGVLCRECGEKANLPMSEAVCAYSAGEFAGSEGLYCDSCSKEIVEPYDWECPHCGRVYCGDEAYEAENEAYKDAESKCCEKYCGDGEEIGNE